MIYACEHHDEALAHWRRLDRRELALCHVDFHDDLRGLLVDRRRSVAYPLRGTRRELPPLDAGNFLAHAVLDGRVRRIRWIHGIPGGRAWDAGIVRYESDLFALHHLWRHRRRGGDEIALDFEERTINGWRGLEPGEALSIDWDCFASILIERNEIDARVEAFLERLGAEAPADAWIAYSPEYSHPSLERFKGFVEQLGRRYAQGVEWLSPGLPTGRLHPTGVEAGLPRDLLMRIVLSLRRRGFY